MKRRDVLLTILAAGNGRGFSPAQIQKAAFLVTKNAPRLVDDGSNFNFTPYDYGPFDANVYYEAETLARQGLAEIKPAGRFRTYSATVDGAQKGEVILSGMGSGAEAYIRDVANWVLSLDFATLVKSVYEAYPEMKVNSVFKG